MLRALLFKTFGLTIACILLIPLSLIALFKSKLREAFTHRVRKERPVVLDSIGTHRYLDLPKGKIRIHIVDTGSDDDSRPLMLFVHGFPDFWFSFRHQMKYFSSRFRCVSIDNRGYNKSDKPKNIQDYSVTQLASDVKEVVQLLGYEKCVLVGHDWGGSISYHVCALYPEIVSFYISLNMPHFNALKDSLERSWSQRLASWYFMFFQAPMLPEMIINGYDMENWKKVFADVPYDSKEEREQDLNAYKYVFSQPNALTGPINYYRCKFQYPSNIQFKEKLIQVPVCSIYGNGDRHLLRESFLGSAKYVVDFTLRELEGITHWVHLHAKDDVNRLMQEYIEIKKDLI